MPPPTSSSKLRLPSEAHRGKNGFRDSYEPADKEHPDDIALRNHRYAQWVLAHKGSSLPGKAGLRELGQSKTSTAVDTLETVVEKIRELKRRHARELEAMYVFHADEYLQEMLDHRRCVDDSAYMNIDETFPDQVEFKDALAEVDKRIRESVHLKQTFQDDLSTLRYGYLRALLPLVRQRRVLRDREAEQRRRRDAMFPRSIDEYHKITDREVQLRIARFLIAGTAEQERMQDKFGWAYRGVEPLLQEYKMNAGFRAEIEETNKDIQASDPRKKGTRDRMLPC